VCWLAATDWTVADVPASNLAAKVLSASNTENEMERKLQEYFAVGVLLFWYIDPVARTVIVYTAPDPGRVLGEEQTLHGGAVLPEFTLPLREFFAVPAAP